MPIVTTDLEYRLSGGISNVNANTSLGGDMSTLGGGVIISGTLHNLFDAVTGAEASAGDTEYRGFYIKNNHATLALQSAVVWIDGLTGSADDEFDIALADEAVNVAMETIANESTAPAGPVFTRPTTKGAGLSIGNIPAQQFKGIWIRRTVNSGAAAVANNSGSVRVEGDTAA